MTHVETNARDASQPPAGAEKEVMKSSKTVFTITSARTPIGRCGQSQGNADPHHAAWLQEQTLLYQQQREEARRFPSVRRTAQQDLLVGQLSLSDSNRGVAARMLVAEAAARDVARAKRLHGDDLCHVRYRRMWWQNFARQVDEFLRASSDSTDQVPRPQRAVENISSLGLWFEDESIALPMRQYTALTCVAAAPQPPCQDGSSASGDECAGANVQDCQTVLTPIVIVGLCQFGYSNYVHDIRRQQQTATLNALLQFS